MFVGILIVGNSNVHRYFDQKKKTQTPTVLQMGEVREKK
jgi:hypothetical protein